ncbi:MAG: hypothetical protein GYB38_03555 [Gammaproteobacteria bacterium]|nr:hypothetical protein [Gammaproteobacteria bacterium]
MPEEKNSIDASIEALDAYIEKNKDEGRRIFSYLRMFSITILMVILMLYILPLYMTAAIPDSALASAKIPDVVLYGLFAIFVVVFGVVMAIYRFHLNEISRTEHYKIGFMRIRVAANNFDKEGFNSEVRLSLTADAFSYQPSSVFSGKEKKVESPLPGHPTSDLSAVLLNKLLDGLEVKKKQ